MASSVRKGDIGSGHSCHYPPTAVTNGGSDVFVNDIPAVQVADSFAVNGCSTCPVLDHGRKQSAGSPTMFINGRPAAHIDKGIIFRSIDRQSNTNNVALTGQSINNMVKSRVKKAGLDPNDFSALALQAGYLTEASRKGISLPETMQQSGHKSIQQAARYYNDSERRSGLAARLID